MIDLARQIESLLLENDCVIVPELGGFIAYSQPARYDEVNDCFLPPIRTIGFNPQLSMNDGLLVQSYMQIYQTDFPDATRIIQKEVSQLKDKLYQEGTFELNNIGTLSYNIKQRYSFKPIEKEVLAPTLYGLPTISLAKLKPISQLSEHSLKPIIVTKKRDSKSTNWIGHIAAAAVAIILFFTLSIPVENTYIDNGNYAALGTSALFEAIRSQSAATSNSTMKSENSQQQKKEAVIPANLKPVTTRVETVAPKEELKKESNTTDNRTAAVTTEQEKKSTTTVTKSSSTKKYHIIVASLSTAEEAKRFVESYQKKGFPGASSIEGGGRHRLSLASYDEMAQAYAEIKKLKEAGTFKDAWVLTAK